MQKKMKHFVKLVKCLGSDDEEKKNHMKRPTRKKNLYGQLGQFI